MTSAEKPLRGGSADSIVGGLVAFAVGAGLGAYAVPYFAYETGSIDGPGGSVGLLIVSALLCLGGLIFMVMGIHRLITLVEAGVAANVRAAKFLEVAEYRARGANRDDA